MGGIHALEHVLISMFPLFALADRYDIGGISHPAHPQVGRAAIFIYDGYPGGVGLSARAYEILEDLVRRALAADRRLPLRGRLPLVHPFPQVRLGQQAPGQGSHPEDRRPAVGDGGARTAGRGVVHRGRRRLPPSPARTDRGRGRPGSGAQNRRPGPGNLLFRRRRGRLGPVPPHGGFRWR